MFVVRFLVGLPLSGFLSFSGFGNTRGGGGGGGGGEDWTEDRIANAFLCWLYDL